MSYELKYESDGGPTFGDCAALIRRHSMQAGRDLLLLMQWAAFNLCIGNNDAHAKNISMLRNGSKLMLAPFYDLISTTFYGHRLPRKLAMRIGGNSRSYYVSRGRWERFAADVTLPPATVLKGVAAMANAIHAATARAEESALAAGTPPAVVAKLRRHVDSRAQSVLEQLSPA